MDAISSSQLPTHSPQLPPPSSATTTTSSSSTAVTSGHGPSGRSKPGGRTGGASRRMRTKNRGSQTCSSSDDDLHSDDNLRPYEEVKVAHHDKKLSGLGLTPDEHAVSPLLAPSTSLGGGGGGSGGPSPGITSSGQNQPLRATRAYSYGSEEESETSAMISRSAAAAAAPASALQQGKPLPDRVVYDPPWDQISFQQQARALQHSAVAAMPPSESDEDNNNRLAQQQQQQHHHRYSHAGTLPMSGGVGIGVGIGGGGGGGPLPPPTFPPPPPPPIEDIPQRSPAPPLRHPYAFGPSVRGNYSEADFRRQASFPEAEVEMELENPYMVGQGSPGGGVAGVGMGLPGGDGRFPRTVPRSGSVPSCRGVPLEQPPHLKTLHSSTSGYTSDTYPYHCPTNPDHPMLTFTNSADRPGHSYPPFGVGVVPGMASGSYPPSNDYTYYSKFSTASQRMKKQLSQRCTWKCTALLLLIMCVALLACTVYFAAMSMFEEGKVAKADSSQSTANKNGVSDPSQHPSSRPGQGSNLPVPHTTPAPQELQAGRKMESSVLPKSFWQNRFEQTRGGFVKFDFAVSRSALLGVYGRQSTPPTHVQFDFFKVLDGSRLGSRSRRSASSESAGGGGGGESYSSKDTALMEFLKEGVWFIGVFNDGDSPQNVAFVLNHHAVQSDCPTNCSGRGDCVNGHCECWEGFHGKFCSLDQCPEVCSGQGELAEGRCRCYKGFKGPDCSLREHMCAVPNCNGNGHCINGQCVCFQGFQGPDCGIEVCRLACVHGHCRSQRCECEAGWAGALCDQLQCDRRCKTHGFCANGSCVCDKGWNGKHCTINGCPKECSGHGECRRYGDGWQCDCRDGWKGDDCNLARETKCSDELDNDNDGLKDCYDPDCCESVACRKSVFCRTAPEPNDILLSKDAPSPTASFFERMRFLIEENSVQMDATRNSFNETQVSVIRGRVMTLDGTPLAGVRVGVVTQPLYGFTLSRKEGQFDILVNGGGSVKLELIRDPFRSVTASVLVPWNQIITMDTVFLALDQTTPPITPNDCVAEHPHYHLRPVVLSTWQHTQLGACPDHSTVIPESQVLQESIPLPGTDVHLVYHSSEAAGYMSLIRIQMTPDEVPRTLRLVHLRAAVEGVVLERVFEADPNLKYTFAWNRLNAYKQKVYGIVTARVYVGYQYHGCDYIFWETRSTTVNGYDLTASHIGGWNLDIHHMYNYQEGILHKGDGTNIYLKEKPKTLVNILGNGERRKLNCDGCNGPAQNNRLLAPVALASGLDGSLYLGDYNFIRKLSPDREEIASILEMSTRTTPYKFHMTVSPVDGRLYISDFMSHKIIRIKTMGPVRSLLDNYEDVAGNGEECTPGEEDLCGDGGPAIQAKLRYPKGIAISKDGVIYVADGPNIRRITPDGVISTLIGTQEHPRTWTPMPCDDILSAERVSLKWPTALAINPLDDSLHILDHSIVLKLTADFKLVTVAGRPFYCPLRHTSFLPQGVLADDEQASSIADHVTLVTPESITFGPHGDLYIVESDTHHINRVRVVSTDGHIHHFAGAKSKCDCQQKERCKCYDPRELLAAQALFSDPTSVTVTPDGVLHLADMGNLRVFSIISQLPTLKSRHYEVVSPETQEIYAFNYFGQHKHTINFLTNQYMYNFTYNVYSSYGRLVAVEDSATNKIQIKRDYQSLAKTIITPNNATCQLVMDNRRRLYQFQAPNNLTETFTYMGDTELLESKHMANGQTFNYEYDAMGRLQRISQPTGAVTVLETDVNATGSIVHVTTDSTDVVAMATYGSVQSVMHGSTQTKVTYLPDGAVVVVFPSNLTVAIETGGHPIMENEHRMHYKRKIIVPDHYMHRLEWRFYLRRKRRTRQSRIVEKIGHRFRVGQLTRLHDSHADAIKEKALLINGENLLTVEYDRRNHMETVLTHDLREIITVVYDDAGLPTHFLPASTYHGMNVTYSPQGDVLSWQYGDLLEQRDYLDHGRIKERVLKPAGVQYRYQYRDGSKKPTDVIVPSGKQYLFHRDASGRLQSVETMVLGQHHFRTLLTIGRLRHLYTAPGMTQPYIRDYDTNGKLLQLLFPSQQRRVVYRYNHHFQESLILYDQTQILHEYHPKAQRLSMVELISPDYECRQTFSYITSLLRNTIVTFPHDHRLVGASMTFEYDNNFRLISSSVVLSNNLTMNYNLSFDDKTGRLRSLNDLTISWQSPDNQTFSNGFVLITREYDGYRRLADVKIRFGKSVRFMLQINYDQTGRVHQWRRRIGQTDSQAVEYQYDIDSHLTAVLVEGQTVWTYAYDPNGNIKKITENGKTRHMEFDVGDKITMFGELMYKYDDDGLTAQRGLDHVAFNSRGQLTTVSRAGGEVEFTFQHTVEGRLALQRDNQGHTMQYFYGNPQVPAQVTHTYNHTTKEASVFFYDTSGSLIAMQRSGKTYYIATDPSRTPLVVFDERGYVVKQCSYTPLGLRILDSNTNFDLPFGFQGAVYNDVVQLAFMDQRVYDPYLGRFLAPDYDGAFDKLKVVVEDPEVLNLYQYRSLVNLHLPELQHPRMDLADWLTTLGYDVQSIAPDVSYTGDLNPKASGTNHQLLTSSSAFECTFRRDMHNLLMMSAVPRSKVTPLHHLPTETASPLEPVFGAGVTISSLEGRAVVNIADIAAEWARKLATVLLNGSRLVDLSFTIKGKDVHYFVRTDAAKADRDLRSLGIHSTLVTYENGVNVSVHRGRHSEVDVRVHSNHTVINVRYGTTVEHERKRVLHHAFERAVKHAWQRERHLLQHSLPSQHAWSPDEIQELAQSGQVSGYMGQYILTPDHYPELADDCNNIRFFQQRRRR
ncbi:teneurin-3-like isoform X4 [Babylonia areolata]|uniref:teneurin-3-like isoform X4 n=1 Tax=Babylonia areolata TaxID=304850 RepID=UPI003FD08FA1